MRSHARAAATVALLMTSATATGARAQVNTENLRHRIKTTGYSVIVEQSLTGDLGNTQGISIGSGLGGGWAGGPHLAFAYGRFDYTRYNGATSVDKTFAHARYNYELEPWLWGEAFAQTQSDAFQKLALRNLFGLGARFRLAHYATYDGGTPGPDGKPPPLETFDVYVGTAYMLERDAIDAVPGATGPQNESVQIWQRSSSYVTVQWQLDPRAILATTAYVQPVFDTPSNVRVLDDTLLTFKISKVFSSSVASSARYDSEPPTGVLRADLEIKNVLTLTY